MRPFIYVAGRGVAPLLFGLVKLPVNPASHGRLIAK